MSPIPLSPPAIRFIGFCCIAATWLFSGRAFAAGLTVLQDSVTWPVETLTLEGETLYGVTWGTAPVNAAEPQFGSIYRVNTDGSGFKVLQRFIGPNGKWPSSRLLLIGGALYGHTLRGGTYDQGTLFRINTDGSGYTILRHFSPTDDSEPNGGLTWANGRLYGTLSGGSNNISSMFRVNLDGSNYSRTGGFTITYGPIEPRGDMVLDGNLLYGTSYRGGVFDRSDQPFVQSPGTLFRAVLDSDDIATVLHYFSGRGGYAPGSGPIKIGSALFGTTSKGGAQDMGVVYRINTDGSGYTILYHFGGTNAGHPHAGLVPIGNMLFGITSSEANPFPSVLFKINLDGSGYTTVHTFQTSYQAVPTGGLVARGNVLFGTVPADGGKVFKYDLNPEAKSATYPMAPNTSLAITLSANSPPAFPASFTLVGGPTHGTLSGTMPNLTYTPAAGYIGTDSFSYKVQNAVAESAPATISINVGNLYTPGSYFGSIAGSLSGTFALHARSDRTGTLLLQIGSSRALIARPTFTEDGSFNVVARDLAVLGGEMRISGQIVQGVFAATISGGGMLNSQVTASNSPYAGSYSARALGLDQTEVFFVVGDSTTYALCVRGNTVEMGRGSGLAGNTFAVPFSATIATGTIEVGTGAVTGSILSSTNTPLQLAGLSDSVPPVRRLANISTRGFVGSGDAVLIVGFVLQGPASKPLLVRAAGPTLTEFGLPGALTRPKLELNQGQTLVATNSGWSSSANALEISTMTTNLGAFAFANGSADAAVLSPAGAERLYHGGLGRR